MSSPIPQPTLEAGAYEVLRARLDKHSAELRERLTKLDTARKAAFGAVEPALLATRHITTEHNCVPRDIVPVGPGRFLLGYNVQFGLKATTDPADVFSLRELSGEGAEMKRVPLTEIFGDKQFAEDFAHLYRYYRDTAFAEFMIQGPHLYMGMRTGREATDIKAFKWRLKPEGGAEYLGNRFDHELVYPPQQEFAWKRTTRDMHRAGLHPHISIEDKLFIETIGGDLTLKVENNTTTGKGIYSEPVEDRDQTLDDAEIHFATVGPLVLLRVLPWREKEHRHLVFNSKTREVHRLDAIADACVALPEQQGIIFPGGVLTVAGDLRTFGQAPHGMQFARRISGANGEDTLHVFRHRVTGETHIVRWNAVNQEADTPVTCTGYALFPDGQLLCLRADAQPQKTHAVQVWRTPCLTDAAQVTGTATGGPLVSIGNPDLVRGIAECRRILILTSRPDSRTGLYSDISRSAGTLLDSVHWIASADAENLAEPLRAIKETAAAAIAEYDRVSQLRKSAADKTEEVAQRCAKALTAARGCTGEGIAEHVRHLGELRTVRGEIAALREVRYADTERAAALEKDVIEATEALGHATADLLLQPDSLKPWQDAVSECEKIIPGLSKGTDAAAAEESLQKSGADLEMLMEIVGTLKINDPVKTTQILDSISAVSSRLNGVRAALKNRRKEIARTEGTAEFSAQMRLYGQALVNWLEAADTPEKCDDLQSRALLKLEELEGRFAELEEFTDTLLEKRQETAAAFEGRRQSLLDARNRRAQSLATSAQRVIDGLKHRAGQAADITAVHGLFAGDLMADKVRGIIAELAGMGETVRADELRTRLKTAQEEALRKLRDRADLSGDAANTLKLGRHLFSINPRDLELSLIPRDGQLCLHVGGTRLFDPVHDETLQASLAAWEQEVVSEDVVTARAEYLAWQFLKTGAEATPEALQAFAAERPTEGYVRGVHELDAAQIAAAVQPMVRALGPLRHAPKVRVRAMLFWAAWQGEERERSVARLHALALLRQAGVQMAGLEAETDALAARMNGDTAAAAYLIEELTGPAGQPFACSQAAADLLSHLHAFLTGKAALKSFTAAVEPLKASPPDAHAVLCAWLQASQADAPAAVVREAAAHWIVSGFRPARLIDAPHTASISGLRSSHRRITGGVLAVDWHEFAARLTAFEQEAVPRFLALREKSREVLAKATKELAIESFKPKPMSGFVRSRLIDEVYLPLVGDNLAKQLGTANDGTRTDRMGMLLLISPPGYGKTTLIEYVASRLGLAFVKINGPALGHGITSLDPASATNSAAREELQKLNLALEMGDNVMLCIDDIQHTNAEFLQKFIPLCDAQRRIEAVWRGEPRTHDLRGRRFAVVMAGNPYTESGTRFQIPDMLANRADVFNLGELIGAHADAFRSSYLENALSSNTSLAPLLNAPRADLRAFLEIAEGRTAEEEATFESSFPPAERTDMLRVLRGLVRVRDAVLRTNGEYIRSAAQQDAYRTEPPFRLQGSYRNMNRMAEKVLPLMTDAEVDAVIVAHYENESRTLSSAAESSLLKWHEMAGTMTPEMTARWDEMRKTFRRNLLVGSGAGADDPVTRVVAQLTAFSKGLEDIRDALAGAAQEYVRPQTLSAETVSQMERIISGLRAVPVDVQITVQPVEQSAPAPAPAPATDSSALPDATESPAPPPAPPPLPVVIDSTIAQESAAAESLTHAPRRRRR